MSKMIKVGQEFLVNTTTLNSQRESTVTRLSDGRFVVVWSDNSQSGGDTSAFGVRAQIFNANGTRSGTEFLVNTITAGDQAEPAITALANGRFLVTWTDTSGSGGDTSGFAIRGQIFNANGSKSGAELLINTTTTSSQVLSACTRLSDGRFVVTWSDGSGTGSDTSGFAIRAQIFNANGTRSGPEFVVNATVTADQFLPQVTALPTGGFVMTWSDLSLGTGDNSSYAIRAQAFNADGSRRGIEVVINTTTANSQDTSQIITLSDGRVVIVWNDASQSGGDTSGYAVRGQILNADGSRSGSEFLINTTTANNQSSPALAALPGGKFVVVWADSSATGGDISGSAIRAQVFNADGSKSGAEFLVNTTTSFNQSEPSVAALSNGDFVVTWTDASGLGADNSQTAVRSQIFGFTTTMEGTLLSEKMTGTGWRDQVLGLEGNDTLLGLGGDDTLDGGTGNDIMTGGSGRDTYYVDSAGDRTIETGISTNEIDTVIASLSWTLGAYVENLEMAGTDMLTGTGNSLANRMTGNSGGNGLWGKGGNDTLDGGGGDDNIFGGGGRDLIIGGNDNDTLAGGKGNDTLTGGTGADHFRFDTALDGSLNVDVVTDFQWPDGDKIVLENSVFLRLTDTGALASSQFLTLTTTPARIQGADSDDFIIYDRSTGHLYYDRDGSGSAAAIQFATLSTGLPLISSDFLVT
jgi:Ca2+-binding RTX toxin-like protein